MLNISQNRSSLHRHSLYLHLRSHMHPFHHLLMTYALPFWIKYLTIYIITAIQIITRSEPKQLIQLILQEEEHWSWLRAESTAKLRKKAWKMESAVIFECSPIFRCRQESKLQDHTFLSWKLPCTSVSFLRCCTGVQVLRSLHRQSSPRRAWSPRISLWQVFRELLRLLFISHAR